MFALTLGVLFTHLLCRKSHGAQASSFILLYKKWECNALGLATFSLERPVTSSCVVSMPRKPEVNKYRVGYILLKLLCASACHVLSPLLCLQV